MLKTFQYRVYPTARQERLLRATLDECCWLYNQFLDERKRAWAERQEACSLYDQLMTLPSLKKERPSLASVHSQVLQNVGLRVSLAFDAFLRRYQNGEKPGYPRFHGTNRYTSLCYPQYGNGWRLDGDQLYLSKIGTVRVVLHRPLEGKPKTVCIRRSSTGKWYVTIVCEWQPTPLPPALEPVGVDVGLLSFATLSTGKKIENPQFFRKEEKSLAKAQRRLAKAAKGTPQRKRRRKVVARGHERTRWKRANFAHQNSRRIVNRFQVIAIEDLRVGQMVHNHCLAKSISDAAWAEFASMVRVKAEWAGRSFVAVNPSHTSQDCSRCGHRQKMPLSERVYRCPCCGLELDRDHNAARNILSLGLQALGLVPRSPRLSAEEQSQRRFDKSAIVTFFGPMASCPQPSSDVPGSASVSAM